MPRLARPSVFCKKSTGRLSAVLCLTAEECDQVLGQDIFSGEYLRKNNLALRVYDTYHEIGDARYNAWTGLLAPHSRFKHTTTMGNRVISSGSWYHLDSERSVELLDGVPKEAVDALAGDGLKHFVQGVLFGLEGLVPNRGPACLIDDFENPDRILFAPVNLDIDGHAIPGDLPT
jgi:hypothetical protein